MPIAGEVLILLGHRRFIDRELPPWLNNVRVMDELHIGSPDLWPCKWIVIDIRLLGDVPKAIAVLTPGTYGVGRVCRHHPPLHLNKVRGERLYAAHVIRNKHDLITAQVTDLCFERIDTSFRLRLLLRAHLAKLRKL